MDQETMYEGVVVPEPVLLKRKHNRYGSVEGLPDEELADPHEIERMIMMEELRPILQLPVQGRKCPIKPSLDEDGRVDWGAFGTADFDKYRPDIDKPLYKANILREERSNVIIIIGILKDRIKGAGNYNAARKLLKYALRELIDVDDIEDWDTWQLAKNYMRVQRLNRQIKELKEKSKQQKLEKLKKWLAE